MSDLDRRAAGPDPAGKDAAQHGRPPVAADGLLQRRYREITLSSVLFGLLFGALLNAAITYAGLKIGFTITGSSIAAVLGFGVLRSFLGARFWPWAGEARRGTILEVNIGQTIASAVNCSNSGIIFTVPVLLLMGQQLRFDSAAFWWMMVACIAGSLLGVAFIVPLRKQMIDVDRLRFPSPTAVGAILKSPGAGAAKSIVLLLGILLGALIYLPAALPEIQYSIAAQAIDQAERDGRVAPDAARRTRLINSWIEARQAPQEVIERGRLAASLRAAREQSGDVMAPFPARRWRR